MQPELIVALDVPSEAEAWTVVDRLSGAVRYFKVGLQLFTAVGPNLVREMTDRGHGVFLDLKLHDIPNTVAGAVSSAARLGVDLLTVHALGGSEMMSAAAAAAQREAERAGTRPPRVIGVTVLTSQRTGFATAGTDVATAVRRLAHEAKEAGLAGVVASVEECRAVKAEMGGGFLVVTPGIRASGAAADDQKRVATPKGAVEAGSDFLVVGRPILRASDPRKAAQAILEEMKMSG